jgi:hypothetical protein
MMPLLVDIPKIRTVFGSERDDFGTESPCYRTPPCSGRLERLCSAAAVDDAAEKKCDI